MCELLLERGYDVVGVVRPSGDDRLWRLRDILDHSRFTLIYANIIEPTFGVHVADSEFDEVYHFAAQSHVGHAFYTAPHTLHVNATATAWLVESLWRRSKKTKLYFAATSEMFGDMQVGERADENYPLGGRSPYAAAKIAAHIICRVFRTYGMFIVSGISFNHESARRGENFVTRKIGLGMRNFLATGKRIELGNVEAYRDWHHAEDTVHGIYLAMQHDKPDEYVLASGEARTVKELAQRICDIHGISFDQAINVTQHDLRPWDVDYLCGDPSKAERVLGWERAFSFEEMLEDVCELVTE
jgi:GDPmannose 4,6-dehydratase